jgi:hypothetical protein
MASHTRNPGAGGTEASADRFPGRNATVEVTRRSAPDQVRAQRTTLPAKASGALVPRYPELDESESLEREIDDVIEIHEWLRAYRNLKTLQRARVFGENDGFSRCASYIEKADQLATRDDISLAVMTLLGSFVTARSELEVRAKQMAYDIGVQKPGLLALSMACRHLRRTLRFAPMISDALDALKSATNKISRGRYALKQLPGEITDVEDWRKDDERRHLAERQQKIEDCRSRMQRAKDLSFFSPDIIEAAAYPTGGPPEGNS